MAEKWKDANPNRQSLKLNFSQGPREERQMTCGVFFLKVIDGTASPAGASLWVKRTNYSMTFLRDDKEDRVLNSIGQRLQIIGNDGYKIDLTIFLGQLVDEVLARI